MDDRERQHLLDVIAHAQVAMGYASAHGARWWKNSETLDAILMRIAQVGEAARRTSPDGLAEITGVSWSDVKGIRARIVHDYDQIDLSVIRGVVSRQLPRLVRSVEKSLGPLPQKANAARTPPARA